MECQLVIVITWLVRTCKRNQLLQISAEKNLRNMEHVSTETYENIKNVHGMLQNVILYYYVV